MSNDIDSSIVFSDEHPGVFGEHFGPEATKCASCGNDMVLHLFNIRGDSPLGDLLGVGTVKIETQDGPKSVPDHEPVCEPCLEHLIEAKRLSEKS